MLFQEALLSLGLVAFASAGVLLERQATVPIPDACTSQCTVLQQAESVTASTIGPLCTTAFQQQVLACYSCIETNAPGEITPQDLTYLQAVFNNFQNACGTIGSPVPSVSVPGATGTTVAYTDGQIHTTLTTLPTTDAPTSTGAPTTTGSGSVPPSASSTSSRSGAMATVPHTFGAGLIVALICMISAA